MIQDRSCIPGSALELAGLKAFPSQVPLITYARAASLFRSASCSDSHMYIFWLLHLYVSDVCPFISLIVVNVVDYRACMITFVWNFLFLGLYI